MRKLCDLTQAALAERSGVSLDHLNKIERGASAPSLAVLGALAEALGVDPATLFLFTASAKPPEATGRDVGPGIDWAAVEARIGLFEYYPAAGILRAAPSLRRLLGQAGKGRRKEAGEFLRSVFPTHFEQAGAALAEARADGGPRSLPLRFIRKDGEERSGVLTLDADRAGPAGEVRVLGALADVSERLRLERVVRAEAGLIERRVAERVGRFERAMRRVSGDEERLRRRFELILSATPDMLSLVDENCRYLFVNDAYEAAFGKPRGDIEGRHMAELLGREYFDRTVAPAMARCLAGEHVFFEHWTEAPVREPRYVSVHFAPFIDKDSGERSALISVRNLTELKLAEEDLRESEKTASILYRISSAVSSESDMPTLYRTVHRILAEALDAESFCIALADRERDRLEYVYFVNTVDAAYPPVTDLARRTPPLTADNCSDYRAADAVLEVMRTAHPLLLTRTVMRLTGIRCPGTMPAVWLGVPIRARREVLGVMAVMRYTDPARYGRKEANLLLSAAGQLAFGVERQHHLEALRAAKEEADRANRAKSGFLAGMSHEFRTPLNAILGLTDVVLKTGLDAEQRDYLETVKDSAEHLLGVINDVLDFTKIEARKMEIEVIDFDLHALLRSLVKALSPAAAAKGLWLALEITPAVPRALRGDPGKLRQILINLVGNAVKFTTTGGVTVRATHDAPAGGGKVRLLFTVTDTGIGIPEDKQEAIFETFRQADGATARKFGGTGLGLAIARELSALMGGGLSVTSKPGSGSVFSFTAVFGLGPLKTKKSRPAHEPKDEAKKPQRVLKVLVAEDNPVNIKLVSIHLQKLGHKAVAVSSGAEALELLATEPFDVVLMDIEMPGMDGLTAARIIRSGTGGVTVRDPKVPIIAVTAHVSDEVRQACAAAGMDDYIGKPVNLEELSAIINRVTAKAAPAPAPTAGQARPDAAGSVLDIPWALGRLGIDRASFAPILAISLNEFRSRTAKLEEDSAAGDLAGMALNAHTLKSTAATIGATRCFELAGELERAARAGDQSRADALAARLAEAFAAVEASLAEEAALRASPRPSTEVKDHA